MRRLPDPPSSSLPVRSTCGTVRLGRRTPIHKAGPPSVNKTTRGDRLPARQEDSRDGRTSTSLPRQNALASPLRFWQEGYYYTGESTPSIGCGIPSRLPFRRSLRKRMVQPLQNHKGLFTPKVVFYRKKFQHFTAVGKPRMAKTERVDPLFIRICPVIQTADVSLRPASVRTAFPASQPPPLSRASYTAFRMRWIGIAQRSCSRSIISAASPQGKSTLRRRHGFGSAPCSIKWKMPAGMNKSLAAGSRSIRPGARYSQSVPQSARYTALPHHKSRSNPGGT